MNDELTNARDEGQHIQQEFSTTTEALIRRGFEAYALPKGPIFRIRNRSAIMWAWAKQKVDWVKRKFGRTSRSTALGTAQVEESDIPSVTGESELPAPDSGQSLYGMRVSTSTR